MSRKWPQIGDNEKNSLENYGLMSMCENWYQFDFDSLHYETFIVDLWLKVSWHQLLTSFWCFFPLGINFFIANVLYYILTRWIPPCLIWYCLQHQHENYTKHCLHFSKLCIGHLQNSRTHLYLSYCDLLLRNDDVGLHDARLKLQQNVQHACPATLKYF